MSRGLLVLFFLCIWASWRGGERKIERRRRRRVVMMVVEGKIY